MYLQSDYFLRSLIQFLLLYVCVEIFHPNDLVCAVYSLTYSMKYILSWHYKLMWELWRSFLKNLNQLLELGSTSHHGLVWATMRRWHNYGRNIRCGLSHTLAWSFLISFSFFPFPLSEHLSSLTPQNKWWHSIHKLQSNRNMKRHK